MSLAQTLSSLPIILVLDNPGKKLFGGNTQSTAERRLGEVAQWAAQLITLPDEISQSSLVVDLFLLPDGGAFQARRGQPWVLSCSISPPFGLGETTCCFLRDNTVIIQEPPARESGLLSACL